MERSRRTRDTATVTTWRARGLGAIAHPWSLLALAVLLLNDTVLKPRFPGVVTGKLSDVAGLVVFALVTAALVGVVVRDDRRTIRGALVVTGTWFAAMKTVPEVAAATERLAEVVVPAASIVADPTDLVALPSLLLAAHCWRHRVAPRAWAIPVLLVASVWSMATSCGEGDWDGDVHVRDDGGFLVVLDSSWEVATFDASGDLLDVTERPRQEDLPAPDRSLETCLPGGTCILGDGHDVLERDDGELRRVRDLDEERLAYAARHGGRGVCGVTYHGVTDVAANDDGVVVVAHGIQGISVRDTDGGWSTLPINALPLADAGTPFEPRAGAWLLVLAGLVLAALPRSTGWGVAAGGTATVLTGAAVLLLGDAGMGSFVVVGASPVLVLAVVVVVLPRRCGGRWLAWTALALAATGMAAEVLLWGWSTGWIARYSVVVALVVGLVATVLGVSLARGTGTGAWPTTLRPRPPVPTWGPPSPPASG